MRGKKAKVRQVFWFPLKLYPPKFSHIKALKTIDRKIKNLTK